MVLSWEDALAYTQAADETGIPIILQAGPSCRAFTPISILGNMFRYLAAHTKTPIVINVKNTTKNVQIIASSFMFISASLSMLSLLFYIPLHLNHNRHSKVHLY